MSHATELFTQLLTQTGLGLLGLLVFPGGLFALMVGLFLKGLDRRIEARLQRRVGPPLIQPYLDIAKLFTKETVMPASANRAAFLLAPLLGLTGMAVCAALLPVPGVSGGLPAMGDLLVIFYLLPLPAIALMVGGSASSSPFGAMGFSREMTLMFAYEMPLLAVMLAVAMKVGMATGGGAEFSLANIVDYQLATGQLAFDPVMIPALLAYLLFLPGTMGTVPFDVPEAETEIIEGPLLEYSGPALAFFHITSALKTVVVLGLGVALFLPGTVPGGIVANIPWFVLKCAVLMAVSLTLVKSATGRFRVDQAFTFYLKYPSVLALASLVLAWRGM
ncbi:respiratory chain complex I subunit 1 family protein [Nitratidesulfovibrio oxamicus]|uniref:respiratory chain complex I subunit 1 family protein n=1 Tax=Nitratidesulfovibrio oxamicus TaxID=32016 RepID=UPI0018C5D525|nr:complex I subunit 1 family protein [Nitratidesulfovibrio oxamicus]